MKDIPSAARQALIIGGGNPTWLARTQLGSFPGTIGGRFFFALNLTLWILYQIATLGSSTFPANARGAFPARVLFYPLRIRFGTFISHPFKELKPMGENPFGNLLPRGAQRVDDPPVNPPASPLQADASNKPLTPSRNGGGGAAESIPASPSHPAPLADSDRLDFELGLFRGRTQEREWLAQKLKQIHQGIITRPLVEIVGPLALGKSWLLEFFAHTYSARPQATTAPTETFSTYINFQELKNWQDSEFDWTHQLLRLLIGALNDQGFTHSFRHAQVHETHPQFPLDPYERAETVRELTRWIEQLAQAQIPILLFDSLQVVPPALFQWLEEELVEPLVRSRRVIIVVAGRYPRVWREPETSQRRDLWLLGELEQKVWGAQPADQAGKQVVPPWIHERYAYGYPGMALGLYRRFHAQGPKALEQIQAAAPNSSEEQALVGPSIQQAIDDVALEGIEPELRELIANVATQRLFNPELLQEFSRIFGGEDERSKTFPYFRQKVRELIDVNIAKFSIPLNDYVIHPPMRRVVAECVRVTQGPENYRVRHEFARNYYLDRLKQAPSMTAEWCIPEILYHTAEIAELEKQSSGAARVLAQFEELLQDRELDLHAAALDKLERRMSKENWDKPENRDLEELHWDFIRLVKEVTFEELVRELQAHNQRVTAS